MVPPAMGLHLPLPAEVEAVPAGCFLGELAALVLGEDIDPEDG